MSDRLQNLNDVECETAETMFRDCCGSSTWSELMAASRPFASQNEVLQTASKIWQGLNVTDWLEAFASHPKIGESKAAANQQKQSAEWSEGEQAGVAGAGNDVREHLAEANRLYEQKFGFIFIVCATGKTAEELLDICRERLGNTRKAEINIAAEEQRKITEIRLRKLFEQ